MTPRDPVERFWFYTQRGDGCWEWTGPLSDNGYGRHSVHGRAVYAHRYAYELLVGPILEGRVIDHLCRVRRCVNPTHMEPVTIGENVLRGETLSARNANATQCINGHDFDELNTYIKTNGYRECRRCHADQELRRRRRRETAPRLIHVGYVWIRESPPPDGLRWRNTKPLIDEGPDWDSVYRVVDQ